jgi:histidinol-phosphate aminotransferase
MEAIDGWDDPSVSRLCSNESPLGLSPFAREAAAAALGRGHEYPEGEGGDLITALGERHGIAVERIRLGGGLDPLMMSLVLAFAGPGDEVVYAAHGYARYARYALMAGAVGVPVPDRGDLKPDLVAMADAVGPRTRLVMLANPDNPSGAWQTAEAVEALHRRLPDDVLLVLDGAYADFVDDPPFGDGGLALATAADNVIAGRTFSKIYGMAGLRLGWLTGAPALLGAVGRTGPSFPFGVVALAAGLAALGGAGA